MNYFKYLLALSVFCFAMFACNKAEKQAEKDDLAIQKYIQANNLTATKLSSGVYVVIEVAGGGESCNANSDVRVAYKGYNLDNEVFDESDVIGITFNLQQVIEGWTIGIPQFREGGKGKLLIPSGLAYGKKGAGGSIPPNTPLVFDVHLIDVL